MSFLLMQHWQSSHLLQGCVCLRSLTGTFLTGISLCWDAPKTCICPSIHQWHQCPRDPLDFSTFPDNSRAHSRHWGAIIRQLTKGGHVYNSSWRYSCFSSPCAWERGFLGVTRSAFSWTFASEHWVGWCKLLYAFLQSDTIPLVSFLTL